MKLGDTVELVCKIRNLPSNQVIHWLFNENEINANVVYKPASSKETDTAVTTNLKAESSSKPASNSKEKTSKNHHSHQHNAVHTSKTKRFDHASPTFVIEIEKLASNNQNVTISKLIIKDLDHHHKGAYKCKYDKVESRYHLDLKPRDHSKVKFQLINHQQFIASKATSIRSATVNLQGLLLVLSSLVLSILCNTHFYSMQSY